MPDVHWGIGATVGSVIPTRGAIIPAAVGVDIGCGMMAVQTSLHANHLPDNLHGIRRRPSPQCSGTCSMANQFAVSFEFGARWFLRDGIQQRKKGRVHDFQAPYP
jgi:tRNA-splicing ligase RtcB